MTIFFPVGNTFSIQIEILSQNKRFGVFIFSNKNLSAKITIAADLNLIQSFKYADTKLETMDGFN